MENLIIGIIAEGKSDHAVIANVLKGTLGIDINTQVQFLVPQLDTDETDLNKGEQNILSFSNWTIVRQQCINKEVINDFFTENPLAENLALVIQIDTAERFLKNYEVTEPPKTKDKDYSETLRENIIIKIKEWLDQPYENLYYAVAIEETEAWLLPLIAKRKNDTSTYLSPKEKYFRELQKDKKMKNVLRKKAFEQYIELSRPLRKNKTLKTARTKNKSLDLFCLSLEEGFNDESQEEE